MGSRILPPLGLVFAFAVWCCAQHNANTQVSVTPRAHPRLRSGPAASIRVDSKLVLVPVTVTDPFGAPFPGLPRESFRLFENGAEQQIRYCSAEDAPISLGVVFDASRSMADKLDQSRAAVGTFFRTAMPGDEFFLVDFSDTPRLVCGFTSDTAYLEETVAGITARNWTALLDAVYMAVQKLKHAHNTRKALLILSDGGDNNSRYTEAEMKSIVREAGACIYSIGLVGSGLLRRHVRLLRQLSEETGGRTCEVAKLSDLPAAVDEINAAMRHQYLLGYVPGNHADDGLYRRVRVTLRPPAGAPPLRASWRTGYYAPAGW